LKFQFLLRVTVVAFIQLQFLLKFQYCTSADWRK